MQLVNITEENKENLLAELGELYKYLTDLRLELINNYYSIGIAAASYALCDSLTELYYGVNQHVVTPTK